jgi:hypothetical protein
LTREQGIQLVNAYISNEPKNLQLFLDWLGITKNSFKYIIDQHRNPKIWQRDEVFQWKLINPNHNLFIHPKVNKLETDYSGSNNFELTEIRNSTDAKNNYIIIGKGADNWD